jgi:GT2 family glycosyltransferase
MPSCDIIIPVWNQPKRTKECVESVQLYTAFPHRLIIIDNGSDRPTQEYLASLKKTFQNVMIERNASNEGFVKAVNKGVRISDAEYACLLNNDTVVTEGWLTEMVAVAEKDPTIGLVNPSSNNLGQRPGHGESITQYAKGLESERGANVDLGSALGFCMLIKRDVIRTVGMFDEIFDMGNFEDTDFSLRAKREGYRVVRARGAYVYHAESSSFKVFKRYKEQFERNKRIFEARWGKQRRLFFVFLHSNRPDEMLRWKIKKSLENNGWVFIACRTGRVDIDEHSRVKVYEFGSPFTARVLVKILFKKKRFDEIYCDDGKVEHLLRILQPVHRARVTLTP